MLTMLARCGTKKVWHWAHKGRRHCDHWWENETEWHRDWKNLFLSDWQDVPARDEAGERERKRRTREVFVPLSHAPGHAQVDFGEALGEIGGVVRKLHYFAMSLPHSDAFFIKACPAETTEAFCDGHVSAFAFFGGVPLSGLYDNTTIAVARIPGDGTRQRTRTFSELQSHYLFEDRFDRPGKGNDKGSVEGTIGYGRRNFLGQRP